jgi:hypothetical protein
MELSGDPLIMLKSIDDPSRRGLWSIRRSPRKVSQMRLADPQEDRAST